MTTDGKLYKTNISCKIYSRICKKNIVRVICHSFITGDFFPLILPPSSSLFVYLFVFSVFVYLTAFLLVLFVA